MRRIKKKYETKYEKYSVLIKMTQLHLQFLQNFQFLMLKESKVSKRENFDTKCLEENV